MQGTAPHLLIGDEITSFIIGAINPDVSSFVLGMEHKIRLSLMFR